VVDCVGVELVVGVGVYDDHRVAVRFFGVGCELVFDLFGGLCGDVCDGFLLGWCVWFVGVVVVFGLGVW